MSRPEGDKTPIAISRREYQFLLEIMVTAHTFLGMEHDVLYWRNALKARVDEYRAEFWKDFRAASEISR